MDFDNQLIKQIQDFLQNILKPILTNNTYMLDFNDEKQINTIIKGICCTDQRINPYVREVQLATEYLFDTDDISSVYRNEMRKFIIENYKDMEKMNNYFDAIEFKMEEYECEEMLKLLSEDYKDLLRLENMYNK